MGKQLTSVKWLAIVVILAVGLIHVIEAPECFEEAAYKGWLFYANGLGSLVAAVGIFRGVKSWGWNLGFLMAAGSVLAYILSRTVGLPQIPAEPDAWFEPMGVASIIAEGLFIGVFLGRKKSS